MAPKVTEDVYNRILELRVKYGLGTTVIAERLGLSTRTIRIYLAKMAAEDAE